MSDKSDRISHWALTAVGGVLGGMAIYTFLSNHDSAQKAISRIEDTEALDVLINNIALSALFAGLSIGVLAALLIIRTSRKINK